jgi:TolA-binding protein
MKRIILILMVIILAAFSGCSGNKAEELFETATLEEKQYNPEHAGKLYRELIEKYPDTEYAQKAKQRLSALEGKK